MDRDAPPPSPAADVVPPVAPETARAVGLAGAALAGAAAAVGLAAAAVDLPWAASTARLLLVFAGAVAAGLGVSLRPDRWQPWAVGVLTAGLCYLGTPPHWDSFRMLFGIAGGVSAGLGALRLMPAPWRLGVVSAAVLFHFGGIFLATVAPPPSPWLAEQLYARVYNPYLQFVYLRNAYHFYSPEPGPASLLACLVKTEVGEETTADGTRRKKYDEKWVVLPRRPADIRDPMGLSYYRRLSLTEQTARPGGLLQDGFEGTEVQQRRNQLAQPGSVPFIPLFNSRDTAEYRMPPPEVSRYLLPSYARHLILEHTPDAAAAARTTVKLYRLEHRTLTAQQFTGKGPPGSKPVDPYHPTTYRPYFLGEFGFAPDPTDPAAPPRVELVDPQADLLYWLVPVLPKVPGADKKDYSDYLSVHAGREFDWNQLR